MNKTTLALSEITSDPGIQSRAVLSEETVAEYAEHYRDGVEMPPVTVFFDGSTHWLADGFQRVEAAKTAGLAEIAADLRDGSAHDAKVFSAGANAVHGLRRSRADKRRAVAMLLGDPECAGWSDREIARHCQVGHPLVAEVRAGLFGISSRCDGGAHLEEIPDKSPTRTVSRGGVTYNRNASVNIDANAAPADASTLTDAPVNRNANPPESGQFKTVSRNGVTYKMNTGNIGKGLRKERGAPAASGGDAPAPPDDAVIIRCVNWLAGGIRDGTPGFVRVLDDLNRQRRRGAAERDEFFAPNCSACRHDGEADRPFRSSAPIQPSLRPADANSDQPPALVFCPFCGNSETGADIMGLSLESESGSHFVACRDCGARGPGAAFPPEAARELWNARR